MPAESQPERSPGLMLLVAGLAGTTLTVAYLVGVSGRDALSSSSLGAVVTAAVVSVGSAAVAAARCVRRRRPAVVVPVATAAGTLLGLAIGAATYGYEGELANGLVFRAGAGGVLGLVGGVASWLCLRGGRSWPVQAGPSPRGRTRRWSRRR